MMGSLFSSGRSHHFSYFSYLNLLMIFVPSLIPQLVSEGILRVDCEASFAILEPDQRWLPIESISICFY